MTQCCKALKAVAKDRGLDEKDQDRIAEQLRRELGHKWSTASISKVRKAAKAVNI